VQPALPFCPAAAATPALHAIGAEPSPLLIIDDLLADWRALVDAAATAVFSPVTDNLYPGIRAPMPLDFVGGLARALDPLLRDAFGLHTHTLARAECHFSLVTTAPADLVPLQCSPHIDTSDHRQIAVLLYLCDPRFGGTAFYRQAATGFEVITPEREAAWDAARDAALIAGAAGYAGDSAAGHEQIAAVVARPNRLIAYQSRRLHSGLIPDPDQLSTDPRTGRLTANIFIGYSGS
jgi:hypothetical protein